MYHEQRISKTRHVRPTRTVALKDKFAKPLHSVKRIQFETQPTHLQQRRFADGVHENKTNFVIESIERDRSASTSEL